MNLASTLCRLQRVKQGLRFARNLPRLTNFARVNPAVLIEEWAEQRPHATALLFGEQRWNWRQVHAEVDRWANWLISRNVQPGQVIAILMENRPEYIFLTMAINRIGGIAALINTNLSGEPLRHSLKAANAHHLFADSEHRQVVETTLRDDTPLPSEAIYFYEEDKSGGCSFGHLVLDEIRAAVPRLKQNDYTARNADVFCYIFTSGTTGLPKAAIIRNQRFLGAAYLFGSMMHECNEGDIIYVTLPLYHTNAMLLGWGSALAMGAGIALRRKFSTSAFWSDISRYRATSFVYIGELCRYLLNSPPDIAERDHRLRVAVGNGLRPDIWNTFVERFNIPLMREFYGSTEGNAPAINFSGRPGMIGKLGHNQWVLRCDASTGEVVRTDEGRCIPARAGEVGLLVGKISKMMSFISSMKTVIIQI